MIQICKAAAITDNCVQRLPWSCIDDYSCTGPSIITHYHALVNTMASF